MIESDLFGLMAIYAIAWGSSKRLFKVTQSKDIEIRKAFHSKRLASQHSHPNTIVIDELGVAHGKNRIDIAVLNGCIHGYEIKSSKDNLSRFPSQLETYVQCFEKLTVIAAENHIQELAQNTPDWCGIILAKKGSKGGIIFSTIRKSKKNSEVDLVSMAHFLWKAETIEVLRSFEVEKCMLKGNRLNLYENLSRLVTAAELSTLIKISFMRRGNWRAAPKQK